MSKKEPYVETTIVKDEHCVWTRIMDEALLDGLIHQDKLGNRPGETFTTKAYENVAAELKEKFPDKQLNKQKVFNHFKNMKKKFGPWYDIFKGGLSGFGYNQTTCMWEAESEVWDKLIESKPEAAKFRDKPYPFYDKLAEVYGLDRATGELAETAAEMRAKRKASKAQSANSIEDIDQMVMTNEISLENYTILDSGNGNTQKSGRESANIQKSGRGSPSNPEGSAECGGETSSKKAKTRGRINEEEIQILKQGFEIVADALMKSTAELVKPNRLAINEAEIWTSLEELELSGDLITHAYVFLVGNPEKLRALLACPLEKRKDVLQAMMRVG